MFKNDDILKCPHLKDAQLTVKDKERDQETRSVLCKFKDDTVQILLMLNDAVKENITLQFFNMSAGFSVMIYSFYHFFIKFVIVN